MSAMAASMVASGIPLERFAWLVVPRHARRGARIEKEARRVLGPHVRVEQRFGVLRSWYGAATLAFVGGGHAGRGTHDLLEPLAAGRSPIYFADRGDPGGVGSTLGSLGAAHRLDGAKPVSAELGLLPSGTSWAELQSRLDGRRPTVEFLSERGVVPAQGGA